MSTPQQQVEAPPLKRRHRLFWKILGVFWLTIILATIANIAITYQISNIEHRADKIRDQLESLANDAVTIYETSGEKALSKWYRRIFETHEVRAVLFNQKKEALGHVVRRSHDDDNDDDDKHRHQRSNDKRHLDELDDDDTQPQQLLEKKENRRSLYSRPFDFRRLPINTRTSVISSSGQRYLFKLLPSPYLHKELGSPTEYRWLRFLVTLAMILIASLWLSRHVVKPVISLKNASQRMAAGQLSTRVKPDIGKRKDELGELGDSFDNMATQLEKTILGQKQLLRDISHEIRTPLTRQRIAIDLIREQLTADDAFCNELLGKIETQNNKLNELIENLLTLNRLNEDATQLNRETVDLAALLSELVDDAELEASTKRITLHFQRPDNAVVHGNKLLLARAFENIIGNALKYSPENSIVSLTLAPDANGYRVEIADQGPGLSAEEAAQVFTPFYRADNSRTQQTGGYGLGLAIVKRVIDLHQGSIKLDSVEGNGLKVCVWLPGKHNL